MNFGLGFKTTMEESSSIETLEKQLTCPICLEIFTKPVVILPCQHNLCRKCASDVFQVSSPLRQTRGSTTTVPTGGRFRCPSCRHEVVLDRHGVFGLQRNLLVENIIDIYKQESTRSLRPKVEQQQMMCEEHEEKINIYCLNCETPTCSMCKVFGTHKSCEVAPLQTIYQRQKNKLSDGIAILVAGNDRVQAVISQMEDICRTIEESGQRKKQQLCGEFEMLCTILEERKKILLESISREQKQKLNHVRALIRCHGDHLEGAVKLVEASIHSMEEPEMAVFLQGAKEVLKKITETAKASSVERVEAGYESMAHFAINTDDVANMLKAIDFHTASQIEETEDLEGMDDAACIPGVGGEPGNNIWS